MTMYTLKHLNKKIFDNWWDHNSICIVQKILFLSIFILFIFQLKYPVKWPEQNKFTLKNKFEK